MTGIGKRGVLICVLPVALLSVRAISMPPSFCDSNKLESSSLLSRCTPRIAFPSCGSNDKSITQRSVSVDVSNSKTVVLKLELVNLAKYVVSPSIRTKTISVVDETYI